MLLFNRGLPHCKTRPAASLIIRSKAPDNPARITHCDRICRDGTCHHAPSADHAVFSNGHARLDDASAADPVNRCIDGLILTNTTQQLPESCIIHNIPFCSIICLSVLPMSLLCHPPRGLHTYTDHRCPGCSSPPDGAWPHTSCRTWPSPRRSLDCAGRAKIQRG